MDSDISYDVDDSQPVASQSTESVSSAESADTADASAGTADASADTADASADTADAEEDRQDMPLLLNGTFFRVKGKVGDKGQVTAECTGCKKRLSASTVATSNLLRHLKTHHKPLVAAYEKEKAGLTDSRRLKRQSEQKAARTIDAMFAQKRAKNNQEQVDDAVSEYLRRSRDCASEHR
jgi:hypothetical protein